MLISSCQRPAPFGPMPSGLSLILPQFLGKKPRRTDPPKKVSKHISLESDGNWGVSVAPDLRYRYRSRDTARLAKIEHKIGEAGRVA